MLIFLNFHNFLNNNIQHSPFFRCRFVMVFFPSYKLKSFFFHKTQNYSFDCSVQVFLFNVFLLLFDFNKILKYLNSLAQRMIIETNFLLCANYYDYVFFLYILFILCISFGNRIFLFSWFWWWSLDKTIIGDNCNKIMWFVPQWILIIFRVFQIFILFLYFLCLSHC